MEVILKSKNGVHVHLDANDFRGLLNLKYLCSLLDVPYEGVKARMFRLNESIDQALHHFLSKEGDKND
ncbi:TPA: hypothetical protein K8979_004743 [Escherichia coli]|nr:hypothetical protein [Escherichia coli]HBI8543355.1 hypothetical protein [Escherichia coli]HBI8555251.1 hypothetical protein [Escherichia coli]HBI8557125.1 hypothetical protein [Escherichia coli]HBI8573146.1 hypothetical protein [Escherichia coli]